LLIFNFFDGLGGMALIAAWWGIWHIIMGFIIGWYWSIGKTSIKKIFSNA
jgi:BASS family bile acid:Na+ symporter